MRKKKKRLKKKAKPKPRPPRVETFGFEPGRVLGQKYEIVRQLGSGWEAEVYLLREVETGIARAGKFFYPQRNPGNRTLKFYARKLFKLRHCPILIQYLNQEKMQFQHHTIPYLISDFVEGEMLSEFLKRQPGGRMHPFQALHLLHALASGMEAVHESKNYHGDIHTDNVIVSKAGIKFDLKLLDLHHLDNLHPDNIKQDIYDMVAVLHECVGGARFYASQPEAIKEVVCGLRKGLIARKFPTAGRLRRYLEQLNWK